MDLESECSIDVELDDFTPMDEQAENLVNWAENELPFSKVHSKVRENQIRRGNIKEHHDLRLSFKSSELADKFERTVVKKVPGREYQAREVFDFIVMSENGASSPLSLHGNTGCGKTSLVQKILDLFTANLRTVSVVFINCMTMLSISHVYACILSNLFGIAKEKRPEIVLNNLLKQGRAKQSSSNSAHPAVSSTYARKWTNTKIIVLDEVDQLIKDQSFFYNLLEWLQLPKAKIILIFISNIIDLSQKLEGKIQSRMKFSSIIFRPYSAEQIEQIAYYLYPNLSSICQGNAVSYISMKIFKINSDIRILEKVYRQIIKAYSDLNCKSERLSLKQVGQILNDEPQFHAPQILKDYDTIMRVLHQVDKKYDVSEEIINKMSMILNRRTNYQEILRLLSEMQDYGLIALTSNTKNADATFMTFGIKISDYLHVLTRDEDELK